MLWLFYTAFNSVELAQYEIVLAGLRYLARVVWKAVRLAGM